jgi:hypothetical protein
MGREDLLCEIGTEAIGAQQQWQGKAGLGLTKPCGTQCRAGGSKSWLKPRGQSRPPGLALQTHQADGGGCYTKAMGSPRGKHGL